MVSKRSLNMSVLNNGFRPRLVNFLPLGLALILGTCRVEDRLPVLPTIVNAVQADNRSLKVKANRTGCLHHAWQGRPQEWRFAVVSGSRDKRRETLQFRSQKATTLSPLTLLCRLKPMLSPPFFAAVVVPSPWMMVTSRRLF